MTIHSSSKHWDPDVRKVAEEVDAKFPRPDWTSTYPGHGENSPVGAYAVDYMCDKRRGDQIAEYLWENRKRLGVRYLIWDRRIISETSRTPNRWVPYFNGNSSNPSKAHTNHVHASHYVQFTYRPPTPPPLIIKPVVDKVKISLAAAQAGMRDGGQDNPSAEAKLIQQALNKWRPSFALAEDGWFGRASRSAAAVFQVYISDPPKPTPWPQTGWDAGDGERDGRGDADGILGRQSLTALGFDVQP